MHADSFVYLGAIRAIVTLSGSMRNYVVNKLVDLLDSSNAENPALGAKYAEILSKVLGKSSVVSDSCLNRLFFLCVKVIRRTKQISLDCGVGLNLAIAKITSDAISTDAIVSADQVYIRQSAVCLLADVVRCSGWSSWRYITDILDMCKFILSMQGTFSESHRASRRYALY